MSGLRVLPVASETPVGDAQRAGDAEGLPRDEVPEEAIWVLDVGLIDAYHCPFMPKNFVHWREKYLNDKNCPF